MFVFFFNDTATTEIYTLSLHDALPISATVKSLLDRGVDVNTKFRYGATALSYASDKGHLEVVKLLLERKADTNVKDTDRKSTRLNSSHANISYAVFCLKKKHTSNQQSP